MSLITVNQELCTKCNACSESCPLSLFTYSTEKIYPEIPASNEKNCINCGHCESVCPNGALTHRLSENAITSVLDNVRQISSEELEIYFKKRRSIRQFKSRKINPEVIQQLMDIVRYSPTGTNRQLNSWVVVNSTEVIQQLAASTIRMMKNLRESNPEMANRLGANRLILSFEKGRDVICRNAPHLFIGYTPSNYPLGLKDSVIAASHLELLMPAFGLGGCWAGYLMVTMQQWPEAKKLIGLDENASVHAVLMAGYPKYQYKKVPPRNNANILYL